MIFFISFLRFQLHSFSIVCTTEFGEFVAIVHCLLAIFAYFNQIILCTIVRPAGKLETPFDIPTGPGFHPGIVSLANFSICWLLCETERRSKSIILHIKYNYLFRTDVQLKIVVIRLKHLTWLACTAADKRTHSGFYSKWLTFLNWMRAAFRARSLQDECDRCEII